MRKYAENMRNMLKKCGICHCFFLKISASMDNLMPFFLILLIHYKIINFKTNLYFDSHLSESHELDGVFRINLAIA